jgi:hypothetical protein
MNEHKHDGDLGDGYTVAMHYTNVEIRDSGAEFVALTPEQAIKLLAWLEEEWLNLRRLAREKPTGMVICDRLLTEEERAEVSKAVREYDGSMPLAEYLEKRLGIGIEYINFEGSNDE